MNTNIKDITMCALFVAIVAVSALVTIPFGPVPFTLQTFAITLMVFMLKPRLAFASLAIYLLLGCFGLPVFSSMRGGIGVILGPTGGFLWGYLVGILSIGLATQKTNKVIFKFLLGVALTAIAYACGTIQYSLVAGVSIEVAILACVTPFAIIDCVKIACALAISKALQRLV